MRINRRRQRGEMGLVIGVLIVLFAALTDVHRLNCKESQDCPAYQQKK